MPGSSGPAPGKARPQGPGVRARPRRPTPAAQSGAVSGHPPAALCRSSPGVPAPRPPRCQRALSARSCRCRPEQSRGRSPPRSPARLCCGRTSSGRGRAVHRRCSCPCSAPLPQGPAAGHRGTAGATERYLQFPSHPRGDFLSPLRSGAGETSLSLLPPRAALITEVCVEGGW